MPATESAASKAPEHPPAGKKASRWRRRALWTLAAAMIVLSPLVFYGLV